MGSEWGNIRRYDVMSSPALLKSDEALTSLVTIVADGVKQVTKDSWIQVKKSKWYQNPSGKS